MTSGTLAYSFGLGKAIVSTPYWHGRLLADDGGILVPFADSTAIGEASGRYSPTTRGEPPCVLACTTRSVDDLARIAERYCLTFEGVASNIVAVIVHPSSNALNRDNQTLPPCK